VKNTTTIEDETNPIWFVWLHYRGGIATKPQQRPNKRAAIFAEKVCQTSLPFFNLAGFRQASFNSPLGDIVAVSKFLICDQRSHTCIPCYSTGYARGPAVSLGLIMYIHINGWAIDTAHLANRRKRLLVDLTRPICALPTNCSVNAQ
jgi:hypothetical protein